MELRDVYNVSLRVYSGICDAKAAEVGMFVQDFIDLDDEMSDIWDTMKTEHQQMLLQFVERHCETYREYMERTDSFSWNRKIITDLLWDELSFITSR